METQSLEDILAGNAYKKFRSTWEARIVFLKHVKRVTSNIAFNRIFTDVRLIDGKDPEMKFIKYALYAAFAACIIPSAWGQPPATAEVNLLSITPKLPAPRKSVSAYI